MKKIMNWLKHEESGQGMVEYGLIIALIAGVVILVVGVFGDNIAAMFNGIDLTP